MSTEFPDVFSDLDNFRAPTTSVKPVTTERQAFSTPKKVSGSFLKGPIPIAWLAVAAKLRGKAPLSVGLALWFESGRKKSDKIRLTNSMLVKFSVNRKAKYRALASLEAAGLISVVRIPRKNPTVTILASY